MGLAERVKAAREGLKIWEETHLKDVRAELDLLAKGAHAAEPAAAEPSAADEPAAEEPAKDAGGKSAAADGGKG